MPFAFEVFDEPISDLDKLLPGRYEQLLKLAVKFCQDYRKWKH